MVVTREEAKGLECRNAKLAGEVKALRRAQAELAKRIEDTKRTNKEGMETKKEKGRAHQMAREEEDKAKNKAKVATF